MTGIKYPMPRNRMVKLGRLMTAYCPNIGFQTKVFKQRSNTKNKKSNERRWWNTIEISSALITCSCFSLDDSLSYVVCLQKVNLKCLTDNSFLGISVGHCLHSHSHSYSHSFIYSAATWASIPQLLRNCFCYADGYNWDSFFFIQSNLRRVKSSLAL